MLLPLVSTRSEILQSPTALIVYQAEIAANLRIEHSNGTSGAGAPPSQSWRATFCHPRPARQAACFRALPCREKAGYRIPTFLGRRPMRRTMLLAPAVALALLV